MPEQLAELCQVCERVKWGECVRLGFGKWRHTECYPGSMPWLEYFKRLPASQQTAEGRILREFHEAKDDAEPQIVGNIDGE
jgi:hypothetical protein